MNVEQPTTDGFAVGEPQPEPLLDGGSLWENITIRKGVARKWHGVDNNEFSLVPAYEFVCDSGGNTSTLIVTAAEPVLAYFADELRAVPVVQPQPETAATEPVFSTECVISWVQQAARHISDGIYSADEIAAVLVKQFSGRGVYTAIDPEPPLPPMFPDRTMQILAPSLPAPVVTPEPDVDSLAQFIRTVDGDNSMGAGALAELIVTQFLASEPVVVSRPRMNGKSEIPSRFARVPAPPSEVVTDTPNETEGFAVGDEVVVVPLSSRAVVLNVVHRARVRFPTSGIEADVDMAKLRPVPSMGERVAPEPMCERDHSVIPSGSVCIACGFPESERVAVDPEPTCEKCKHPISAHMEAPLGCYCRCTAASGVATYRAEDGHEGFVQRFIDYHGDVEPFDLTVPRGSVRDFAARVRSATVEECAKAVGENWHGWNGLVNLGAVLRVISSLSTPTQGGTE